MKLTGWLGVIIVLLLGYSGVITYKYNKTKPEIVTNTIMIPGDIKYRDTIIYEPKPYIVQIPIHDTAYIPKDSAQCVEDYKKLYRDYNTIRMYRDSVQNDSSMTIIVHSKVNRNELASIEVESKNNRVKSITNTIVTYSNKVPVLSIGLLGAHSTIAPIVNFNYYKNLNIIGEWNLYNNSIVLGATYTILSK
jgi:hypothetical protein